MRLRLRQIALAVDDLAAACAETAALFDTTHFHDDPGVARYGLRNAVFALGETFLEHVSPVRTDTTVGRLLDKRGGDGGYMVILQTDAIAEARSRIAASGIRVVDRIDRDGYGFSHLHPRDVGGTLLSLDYMPTWPEWRWAGPDWQRHADPAAELGIVAAEMQGSDPQAMARTWSSLLGRPKEAEGDGWRIALDDSELRFVPLGDGRGEGLRGLDVRTRDAAAIRRRAAGLGRLDGAGVIRFCGVDVRLVQAAEGRP